MMKKKKYFLFIIPLLTAFAIGFSVSKPEQGARKISSKISPPSFTGKVRTSFTNQIAVVDRGQNWARLKASVDRKINQEGFDYKWILPDGVQLTSGDFEGRVNETSNKRYEFLVEVSWSEWPGKEMIFFHIKTPTNIGNTATWFPDTYQEVEMLNAESMEKTKDKKPLKLPKGVKVMQ